jgi:hypothetical protein
MEMMFPLKFKRNFVFSVGCLNVQILEFEQSFHLVHRLLILPFLPHQPDHRLSSAK